MASFNFRNLKVKAAKNMGSTGAPLERIQLLIGHGRKATTEIHIKQRWQETAQPNMIDIG